MSIQTPLSKTEVIATKDWLDSNKSSMPEAIYNNFAIALKCCEAIDHLKLKIKDMIALLAVQMGIAPKSEKGKPSKHAWRVWPK